MTVSALIIIVADANHMMLTIPSNTISVIHRTLNNTKTVIHTILNNTISGFLNGQLKRYQSKS